MILRPAIDGAIRIIRNFAFYIKQMFQMKKILLVIAIFCCSFACSALESDGFEVRKISLQVKNFTLDSINLSSPLNYYLSRTWVRTTGQQRLWSDISTSKFSFDTDAPDEEIDDEQLSYILNENIDFIVTYRDSVASIITHSEGEDFVLLNYCWIEDGRWVNAGQSMADDFSHAEEKLKKFLPINYANLPRISMINNLPDDVMPFADFLHDVTTTPEQFLLDMLASHKLVINGEIHRRKVSWDMLRRLIAMPQFTEKVGHLFMELPSWCQPVMDEFMDSDTMNEELIFQIFREEQPNGWWDRGEFEFICDLWRINHRLPQDHRIKVVLADYQMPYSKITTAGNHEAEDRNTHMADVITKTLSASADKRNSLFLVGCGHAYKSNQAGMASAAYGEDSQPTAAAQLVDRLGENNVFTVFQHIVSGDNGGGNKRPIRGGVFDKAFALNGNRPVGFKLADSPFGKEPFDGIYEIKYKIDTGSFSDNYDGYLFLHSLSDEPKAAPLTEIFTDEFVAEMKRRANVMQMENYRWIWFGKPASELTRDYIISVLQE